MSMFLSLKPSPASAQHDCHVTSRVSLTPAGDYLIEFVDESGNIPAKLCGKAEDLKNVLQQIEHLRSAEKVAA